MYGKFPRMKAAPTAACRDWFFDRSKGVIQDHLRMTLGLLSVDIDELALKTVEWKQC